MKVLTELIKGKNNPEIGDLLHISRHTVKIHVGKILEKFAVHNRIQATVKALKENLLDIYED